MLPKYWLVESTPRAGIQEEGLLYVGCAPGKLKRKNSYHVSLKFDAELSTG